MCWRSWVLIGFTGLVSDGVWVFDTMCGRMG